MAFPTNPSDGDFYNENGVTWLYVSPPGVWTKAGGTPITIDESDPVFSASAAASYTEAPIDGTPYSRQDGGWVAAGSGGATVINDLTDVTITTAANGEVLQYNGAAWVNATAPAGYTDADVDTHLNTGTAGAGEVLSWTGADYDWIAAGGSFDPTENQIVLGTHDLAPDLAATTSIAIGSSQYWYAGNTGIMIGWDTQNNGTDNIVIGNSTKLQGSNSNAVCIGNNAGNGLAGLTSSVLIGHNAGNGGSAVAHTNSLILNASGSNNQVAGPGGVLVETSKAKMEYSDTNGWEFTEDIGGTPVTYDLSSLGGGGGGTAADIYDKGWTSTQGKTDTGIDFDLTTEDFWFEIRVFIDGAATYQNLFTLGGDGVSTGGIKGQFLCYKTNSRGIALIHSTTGDSTSGTTLAGNDQAGLNDNQWVTITIQRASGVVTFWLNGQREYTGTPTAFTGDNTGGKIWLWSYADGGTIGTGDEGRISDFRFEKSPATLPYLSTDTAIEPTLGTPAVKWETTTVFGGDTINYAPAGTWLGVQTIGDGLALGSKADNANTGRSFRLFGGAVKSLPFHGGIAHYASKQTIVWGHDAVGFAVNTGSRSMGINTAGEFVYHGDALTIPKFKIGTGGAVTFNNAFTFPTADGTANQVLTTNGSGTVTWQDAGGGGGASIDESGRIESNNWITTANDGGEDRFYFKASDSVSATPTWRGQSGGGFQFNFFNVNEAITFSEGADAVEITGAHRVTGGVEGLRINGVGGGTTANQALFLATDGTDRIEIRGPNIIMPTLPTSDPAIAGALWNNSGVLNISAG